jgi:hypothetical protein
MQTNDLVCFDVWREDLSLILEKFQAWRFNTRFYFLKVFIFSCLSMILLIGLPLLQPHRKEF